MSPAVDVTAESFELSRWNDPENEEGRTGNRWGYVFLLKVIVGERNR